MTDREDPGWGPYRQPEEPEPAPEPEPFTLEKGKEQLGEGFESVKEAGKEIATWPVRDAIGAVVNRVVDAMIGFAEGAKGEKRKKK